jgi:hypothetical protein
VKYEVRFLAFGRPVTKDYDTREEAQAEAARLREKGRDAVEVRWIDGSKAEILVL